MASHWFTRAPAFSSACRDGRERGGTARVSLRRAAPRQNPGRGPRPRTSISGAGPTPPEHTISGVIPAAFAWLTSLPAASSSVAASTSCVITASSRSMSDILTCAAYMDSATPYSTICERCQSEAKHAMLCRRLASGGPASGPATSAPAISIPTRPAARAITAGCARASSPAAGGRAAARTPPCRTRRRVRSRRR